MPAEFAMDLRPQCGRQEPTQTDAEVEAVDLTGNESGHESAEARSSLYNELVVDRNVVIHTDGAARNNPGKILWYGGCGAYWGPQPPFNLSVPLANSGQTDNGGEQAAVVSASHLEVRRVEVRIGSKYMRDGALRHRDRDG